MPLPTRTVLGVAGWLAVAAGAVTAGIVAVGAIGSGIAGSSTSPLSNQAVASALSRTPTATTPAPTRTTPSGATGTTRVLAIPGGTVVARCAGGEVTLTSWSPAQGFHIDDVDRGPAARVRLTFKSDRTEVVSEISCRQGIPTAQTVSTDDRGKNRH